MESTPAKHITVGVLIDSADGYMNKRVLNDCIDLSEEYGIHPVFFLGGSLEPAREPAGADFLYSIPHRDSLDALIAFPNAIAPWNPKEETLSILKKLPGIPVYSANGVIPGCFSVTVDEKPAITQLVDHLVIDHGYTNFAMITGPDSPNSISRSRRRHFEERLSHHGIQIPPEKVFFGGFTNDDGKHAIDLIFLENDTIPEAIIALNDQMATGAIEELLNRGIAVPADIAVTGFDDVGENNLLPCSLTTVRVPIQEMLAAVMREILKDTQTKSKRKTDHIALPAVFVRRKSCGLSSAAQEYPEKRADTDSHNESSNTFQQDRDTLFRHDLETILDETLETGETETFSAFLQNTVKRIIRTEDVSSGFIDIFTAQWTLSLLKHSDRETQILINTLFVDAIRLLVRGKMQTCARIHANDKGALNFSRNSTNILSRKPTMQEALSEIGKNLSALGIERCVLVFTDPEHPETGIIRLSYKKRYFKEIPTEDYTRFPISRIINAGLESVTAPLAILPVAINTDVFGYLVLSITENSFEEMSLIKELVSRLVAGAAANESLSSQISYLEQKNTVLSRLSTIDEFTGLHNRRILHEAGKDLYTRTLREGNSCCCIFFDMDGLKKINDGWGHPEGDTAIKALAAILRKSFRKRDLLVRYGGDEFIVLMFDIRETTVKAALERVARHLEQYNTSSGKPWQLQSSWGVTVVSQDRSDLSFEDLIEETDGRLYEDKVRRREAGLR